jgi:prepilin-type processing-associated H-X9-DG protein
MFRLFLLIISVITLVEVVQAADAVVIRAHRTDSFHSGQLLDSQMDISLPDQADFTVVFADGHVQTITGPYQGQLTSSIEFAPNDPEFLPNFVKALNEIKTLQERVTRGPSNNPEDIWWVDVATQSTQQRFFCIAPAINVVLWRPQSQSDSAATVLIKHRPTGKEAKAVWPAYQTTLKWPESLPIIDGETYNVEVKTRQGAFTFKRLVLYKVPDSLPTNSHKVVWMVGRGCISQANMLLASLH